MQINNLRHPGASEYLDAIGATRNGVADYR